jgi:hypothetical protein
MDILLGVIVAFVLIDRYERNRDPRKRDIIDRLVKWQWRD